ncbi:hypothetical protein AB0346_11460 [Nocardia beijingensis]|uniref:hypothetical protein n=1 Tax=Nocardia beijingensis TaxID=95162 RepID=UPI00344E7F51
MRGGSLENSWFVTFAGVASKYAGNMGFGNRRYAIAFNSWHAARYREVVPEIGDPDFPDGMRETTPVDRSMR